MVEKVNWSFALIRLQHLLIHIASYIIKIKLSNPIYRKKKLTILIFDNQNVQKSSRKNLNSYLLLYIEPQEKKGQHNNNVKSSRTTLRKKTKRRDGIVFLCFDCKGSKLFLKCKKKIAWKKRCKKYQTDFCL